MDERVDVFLEALGHSQSAALQALRREAEKAGVPIIRTSMEPLLETLLAMREPDRLLEIGTAVGYSALFFAEHTTGCEITTIERDPERIRAARQAFAGHPQGDRITLLEGEAQEWLEQLEGPYDLIFMDGAKGQYIHFLPQVIRLLGEGGLLISDNVLQDGDILESHYALERRGRTIHRRMRDYLYALTHHAQLTSVILPVADGVAISTRRREKEA